MSEHRMAKIFATAMCVVGLTVIGGCGGGSNGSDESMLDTQLIGSWKLTGTTIGTNHVTCPGSDSVSGFLCGDNEVLTLNSDGSYDETIATTIGDKGFWFGVNSHLNMDDTTSDKDPASYVYTFEGDTLKASALNGVFVTEYQRQGDPSTLTQQEIIEAKPELNIDNLIDPNLVGSWRYVSITINGIVTPCPYDSGIPGISCGENEVVKFNGNNTFSQPNSNGSLSEGNWYALYGRLFMDDSDFLGGSYPLASVYTATDSLLTMEMWNSQVVATLERVK